MIPGNNKKKGVIYLRDNQWFRIENVIKLGIASSAKDRENGGYVTGEVIRGQYTLVIEIPHEQMRPIEKLLQFEFKSFHDYRGGGKEFYKRCISHMIEPVLQSLNIEYKVLSKHEIDSLERCERITPPMQQIISKINISDFIRRLKERRQLLEERQIQEHQIITPNPQQQHVLNGIAEYYRENNIGKIIWACGLGKALLSILIVKELNVKHVVIGVPGLHLQKQIQDEITRVFPAATILYIGGDNSSNIQTVRDYLKTTEGVVFVIATYHSCNMLVQRDIQFDFKIGDEAHHLVGLEKEEGFRQFHNITSSKTLFMIATEKTTDQGYSMDDETYFGKNIDSKSVKWAIENKRITDYSILVIKNTEEQVDEIIQQYKIHVRNKELFISGYMCLKSFEQYGNLGLSHILLYTNTIDDAKIVQRYIDQILSLGILSIRKEDVYNNALYSNSNFDTDTELKTFKAMKYGIISCVFLFGEGFNEPKLNGVCIACNMQSETRIVQYLLRPNRLERGNPNKTAFVIIPYIDYDDWENENKSYQKTRNIVAQLRNVDEHVEQKIKSVSVVVGNKRKQPAKSREDNDDEFLFEDASGCANLKLRLRHSKAIGSKMTEEQDEFNYVKSINAKLNIQSIEEYVNCENSHCNFVKDAEEYFKSKGVWTNWYDFLGINTAVFFQTKQEWITFCRDMRINSLDDYKEKCKLHNSLPKEPAQFYKDFTNIQNEIGVKIRRI